MVLFMYSRLLLLTLLSLFFTLSTSSEEFSTTALDVTASISRQSQTQTTTPTSSSPDSFTLQLHPWHSLFQPHHDHKDHHSFLRAQLARDSARVNWILNKLNDRNSETRPEDLSAPVTSGVSLGSGEYFARIGVGQPPQKFYMVVDTGSDVTWLQCRPCTRCYPQSGPIFDPAASSSYSPLTCDSQQCGQLDKSSCANNNCQYMVTYGDGSFTRGDLVTETVSFGQTGSVSRVPMGCGHVNGGLFVASAGVLGLGSGPLSLITQTKATSFSYCLVGRTTNKTSTLEFNSPRPGDSVTARLLRNPNPKLGTFYYAGFTGVSVGGQRVPVPASTFEIDASGNGGLIVDSGTAVTRLQRAAYEAVRDAFTGLARELPRVGGALLFDTCYNFSGMGSVSVPTVSFEAEGGRSWRIPPEGYLIPVNRGGIFCFALAPLRGPVSILGNVQQQGTRVSFDLANSLIGFSSYNC